MRLVYYYLVLIATIALLSSCDAGPSSKNIGQANLLGENLADHGIDKRFLRTTSDETDNADDEERGLKNAMVRVFRSVEILLKRKTLRSDPKIKEQFATFKRWYKQGYKPEDVWKNLNLGPLARESYMYGRIADLKANPDYIRYQIYERFYMIVKRRTPKN